MEGVSFAAMRRAQGRAQQLGRRELEEIARKAVWAVWAQSVTGLVHAQTEMEEVLGAYGVLPEDVPGEPKGAA